MSKVTFGRCMKKMLARNPALEDKIIQGLKYQKQNGWFKIKLAARKKYHDLPVYEFRLNDPSVKALRIAFTKTDQEIHVLYASTTLLKKAFTKELEALL